MFWEAGRVISQANEKRIRDALGQLKSVLGILEDDSEKEPEEPPTEPTEPEEEEPEDEEEETKELPPAKPKRTKEAGDLSLEPSIIPLLERAVRSDGTAYIKLIQPGWGSSGYYPREVLERDGPKVFKKGTKQFWNHPTVTEEALRPEGDLRNLAGELLSDARYEWGPLGEGLYAETRIFGPYQEALNELAPHIGVSIRAAGRAEKGKAEGKEGQIITSIKSAQSADYVTVAGAGGEIVSLFESYRGAKELPNQEETMAVEQELKELKESIQRLEQDNARLREGAIMAEAKELIRQELGKTTLPAVTRTRLVDRIGAQITLQEGKLDTAALGKVIEGAVADETAYLAAVSGFGSGKVTGMGESGLDDSKREAITTSLAESFVRLGIKKELAQQIAADDWS